ADAFRASCVALAITPILIAQPASAQLLGNRVEGKDCAIVVGDSVHGSTITNNCGISQGQIEQIVRLRTQPLEQLSETQRQFIARLQADLDLNQGQIREALNVLGEKDVPPERLAAKLVEIAKQFKALQASASTQPGDDPKVAALKADAQRAI